MGAANATDGASSSVTTSVSSLFICAPTGEGRFEGAAYISARRAVNDKRFFDRRFFDVDGSERGHRHVRLWCARATRQQRRPVEHHLDRRGAKARARRLDDQEAPVGRDVVGRDGHAQVAVLEERRGRPELKRRPQVGSVRPSRDCLRGSRARGRHAPTAAPRHRRARRAPARRRPRRAAPRSRCALSSSRCRRASGRRARSPRHHRLRATVFSPALSPWRARRARTSPRPRRPSCWTRRCAKRSRWRWW